MSGEKYYLSSLESRTFEPVRECRFTRLLRFTTDKPLVEADITPPVIGQPYGWGDRDISTVVLTPRHEGSTIDPISDFPLFVHIAIPHNADARIESPVDVSALQVIAWGELYRTAEDAEQHRFG